MRLYDSAGQLKIVQAGGGGGLTNINLSAGTTSNLLSAVTFSNSNGISFGINASTITASHNALTSQSNQTQSNIQGVIVSDTTYRTGDVSFSNLNGVSFGSNGANVVTASIATSLTNIRVSAGITSNLLSAITFSNSNNVSFGLNGSVITGSAGVAINFSAGTQASNLDSVVFSNSNGLAFGLSNGTITGSYTVPVQTNQTLSWAATSNTAGNTSGMSVDARSLTLQGRGDASVGFSTSAGGSSIIVSMTQSNQAFSADASSTFQTLTFQNSNLISFSNNAGAIRITHDLMASTSRPAFSAVGGSSTFQTLLFNNINGVAWSNNTGAIQIQSIELRMFAVSNTTQSSSGSANHSALSFGGAGIASVGVTGGSVVISVPAGAPSPVNFSAGTTSSDLGSVVFSNSNRVSFGLNGSTITAQHALNFSAGATSFNISDQIVFSNSNGVSFGINGSTITASVRSEINFSAGTLAANLGSVVFSNSNGVSFGLNGSTITGSVGAAAGVTLSGYDGYANDDLIAISGGQATLWIDRLDLPCAVQFDRVGLRITHSNATNSSGSGTISVWLGFSTRNASTLSSYASTSFTTAFTQSGTVGSYSNYGGIKILPIPWTTTITAGNYWFGIVSRTTTGGANMTFGNLANSQIASTMSGYFGSGSNATNGIRLAVGVYSVTTAGLPAAISITQIQGNSSAFLRQPAYLFMSNIF